MLNKLFWLSLEFFLCWLISVTIYNPVNLSKPVISPNQAITVKISDMPMMYYKEVK